jgi:hypothetical protein
VTDIRARTPHTGAERRPIGQDARTLSDVQVGLCPPIGSASFIRCHLVFSGRGEIAAAISLIA